MGCSPVIPTRCNQVWSKIKSLVSPQKPLLTTGKRWKLARFGHVTHQNNLSKIILKGTLESGQRHGWRTKCWMDNIKEWICSQGPPAEKNWNRIPAEWFLMPHPHPPMTKLVKGLNWTVAQWLVQHASNPVKTAYHGFKSKSRMTVFQFSWVNIYAASSMPV